MANLGVMLADMSLLSMQGLVSTDITTLLNKCQREEIESYAWSQLFTNIVITAQLAYSTGTITLTQGSATAVGNGTTFTSNMVNWFLWSGPTLTTPVIASFVDATHLSLSTAWGPPTQTNVGYTFQPLYYDAFPLSIVYDIRQIDDLVERSQAELNLKDPSRIATGGQPSLEWAPAPFKSTGFTVAPTDSGHFQFELWPRPTMSLPYIVSGKLDATALAMSSPTDMPFIPSQVLEAKAMMYLCRSAFANNSNPKWLQLAQEYQKDYITELDKAKAEDNKRIVPAGIPAIRNINASRAFDAAIDYNHDFVGPPYRGA